MELAGSKLTPGCEYRVNYQLSLFTMIRTLACKINNLAKFLSADIARGMSLVGKNDKEAIKYLNLGLEKCAVRRYEVRLKLAECHFRLAAESHRHVEMAQKHLRTLIRTNPRYEYAYHLLTETYIYQGDYLGALWCMNQASRIFVNSVAVAGGFLSSAAFEVDVKLRQRALQYARDVVSNGLLNDELKVAFAKYFIFSPHAQVAEKLLLEVLKIPLTKVEYFDQINKPKTAEPFIVFGTLLERLGTPFLALELLRKGLGFFPGNAEIINGIAKAYLAIGGHSLFSIQAAISACQKTHWQNVHFMRTLANCYIDAGLNLDAYLILKRARVIIAENDALGLFAPPIYEALQKLEARL